MSIRTSHRVTLAVIVAATLVACSSDSTDRAAPTADTSAVPAQATPPGSTTPDTTTPDTTLDTTPGTTTADTTLDSGSGRPTCSVPTTTTALDAQPVAGIASDVAITSFDGTVIRAHWFPVASASATEPAPTVLAGPGWGSAGDTDTSSAGLLGTISIARLWDAGYNVLTWDPRGFGASTGTVTIDSPDNEGRDVQQLLDWVADQPEALLDADRDPRVGMVGGSYGGAIQLVTAGIDCRVDAIVPTIAWNSLATSLYKSEISKIGWSELLSVVSTGRDLDPNIGAALAASRETGTIPDDIADWFAMRGAPELIDDIQVPTLIVQGTVDTLFTLDEAVTNFTILRDSDVPTAMLWFCGGHGTCLSNDADNSRVVDATIAWLDRYVRGDATVDTGSTFEIVDQNGAAFVADDYPTPTEAVGTQGDGTLDLVDGGGAGPAPAGPNTDPVSLFALGVTPGRATNAVEVTVPFTADALLVGAPTLTLTYSGTVADGERPTRVFAQLVDDATDLVLGNQITPVAVVLDGASHTITLPLELIAHSAAPGASVTLQIVATTVAYAQPRLGGSVTFDSIRVDLPVVTTMRAVR